MDGFRGVVARERETTGWIRQVKGVNGGAHATHGIFNIPLVGDEDTVNSQSRLVIWVTGLSPSLSLATSTLTKPRIKRFGVFRPCLRMSTLWNRGGKVIGFEGNVEIRKDSVGDLDLVDALEYF